MNSSSHGFVPHQLPQMFVPLHAPFRVFSLPRYLQLTYLPKKYHQYIVPGVRRVYIETSAPDLQKKLAKAEARIRKLERDQEILLEQCEQHMSAAHAHAQGELKARTRVAELKDEVQQITTYAAKSKREYEGGIENIEEDRDIVRSKYEKLKVRYREIAAE
jgi:hypothetical protein